MDERISGAERRRRAQAALPVLSATDLLRALALGWRDFARAPAFGLFFGGVYAAGGWLLAWLGAGTIEGTLLLSLGFPLIAPFAAVGLYEVSRVLERGDRPRWGPVLGVIAAEKDRQIPWLGALIVFYFLFYSFLAHMIFAMFMGLGPMTNVLTSYDIFLTPRGLTMIAVEMAVGGVLAFLLFSLTVVSLPMVLDREVDFVTAMLTSMRVVRTSPGTLLLWAAIIAVALLAAMLPLFLGLLVVLPILGHATWHLYRRAVPV
ncbi:hypothetical protein OCGS_1562 [Oceaniovalibus guishaninsula JLT2003]|uniref:DUF2189 domain-containing protein n=1 Tax=Oceaniovalibus guishaninsula JLT2003 TaxID=1231392 RepID=K2H9U2_9RHOB|nr:DUF2189 domain-containing protein [Oceaniovalibus guishaninsula]EKE44318.1 hypothetical protein OCGS_1562 [Oceaniovalibus guishaninsula JLT2003]